jgi:heme/copper-type cytochrome/quinol oxidase subunit 3
VLRLTATLAVTLLWVRDITLERTHLRDHTLDVVRGLNIRILLFIATEVMVFVSIF